MMGVRFLCRCKKLRSGLTLVSRVAVGEGLNLPSHVNASTVVFEVFQHSQGKSSNCWQRSGTSSTTKSELLACLD